jgi:predicted Zn-dependent protease
VLVAQRQLDQAASMLAEVLTRNPRDGDALLLRAGIALERGEAAGAISDLRAVLRDRPRSTQVMQMLGRAHLANGEPALAEEQLRAAVEASPGEPELVLALAQVQIQQGKGDAAVASLQDAARAFPKNLPIRESLVRAQLDRPDLPAARRDAEAIERDNPGRALGPYLEGLVAQADHRPAEAEAKLEQALTLQPDAVDVLGALARLHASQGHLPRAIERIGRFTQAQPNNAGGLNLLAELYLAAADYPSAIEQLTRTIRVAPRWSVPYRNLALAQLRSGNPPAAELAYRQGIASAGEDPPLVSGLASLYEERGRPEDAIGLYESLHRRQPRLALAANNLAMLLVTYRKDAASLDRARDLTAPFANSPNASLLDTVGWVRFKRGELALALPVLERAAVRAPQSPVIQYHLGMAELRTGDRERARVSLQSAVHTEQHFVGLDEARTALAQIVSKRG